MGSKFMIAIIRADENINIAYGNPKSTDPFAVPVEDWSKGININLISPYAAIQEAVAGFRELGEDVKKTFIFTGNASPHIVFPVVMNLVVGKRGVASLIEHAVQIYQKEEYRCASSSHPLF
jgi:hypothetical protein